MEIQHAAREFVDCYCKPNFRRQSNVDRITKAVEQAGFAEVSGTDTFDGRARMLVRDPLTGLIQAK